MKTEHSPQIPAGAFRVPVLILEPPSLVKRALARLEVASVGDLLAVSEAKLETTRGIGEKKAQVIRQLQRRARSELAFDRDGLSDASETQLLSDRLSQAGVDMDQDWEHVLRTLPTRARRAFEGAPYRSIGALVGALERGELKELSNFGPRTREAVVEVLETIAVEGLEEVLFGRGGRPTDVSALVTQALDSLGDGDREIVRRRIFDEATFGEIGEAFGVSFQAIQARFDSLLDELGYRLRPEALELVRGVEEAAHRNGGLVSGAQVAKLTDGGGLREVLFCLQVAGAGGFRVWEEVFLTNLDRGELKELLDGLRDRVVGTGRAVIRLKRVRRYASELGLYLPEACLSRFLVGAWKVDISSGAVQNPWARRSDHVANVLEDISEPMSSPQILGSLERSEASDLLDGFDQISERALNGLLHRHEDIYTVQRGTYVHASALPVSLETLGEIVMLCVQRLRGESGQMSTKYLLRELSSAGVSTDGVTPYLLKDALSRRPDVLTFKNTYLVAHAETFEDRGKTLADRVDAVLQGGKEPFTVEDVVERLPEGIDYHRMSIYTTLLTAPFSLNLGNNRFVHTDFVGMSRARREQVCDAVVSALNEDGTPRSCNNLLDSLGSIPAVRALKLRRNGAGLLWGLLREDERVVCGPGELVARDNGSEDQHVLRTAILQIVGDRGVAYPREVRRALREEYGYQGSDSAVFGALARCAEGGRLIRLPDSLYVRAGEDKDVLEHMGVRVRAVKTLLASPLAEALSDDARRLLLAFCAKHGLEEAAGMLESE